MSAPGRSASTPLRARVLATFGRSSLVRDAADVDAALLPATRRGRKGDVVVGDFVQCSCARDQATIESIEPRQTLLFRADAFRTKELAEVQIDRGIPFVAVDRFRAAAAARGVPADDVEDVAAAYERAQQQGLESGALLVVGLGAIVALLAGWMPSEVASAASGRRTRSPG